MLQHVTTLPWYTDDEIDDMCAGLSQPAAKIKHLRSLGLTVERKPNGRPLLMRAHAELVLAGKTMATAANSPIKPSGAQPDRAGLVVQFSKRKA